MATTFASATATTNTTNSSSEIRPSMTINRVPLVSAQTTNCEQAISAKQLYLDQSIHMNFKHEKRLSSLKEIAEQANNSLENRFSTDATTGAIIDTKTATTTAIVATIPTTSRPSSNKDDRPNLTGDSQSRANQAHNSSQVRSSNCQIDKSRATNSINQASAIKQASGCANKASSFVASSTSSSTSSSNSSSISLTSSSSSSSSSSTTASASVSTSGQVHNSQGQNQSYQQQYQEEFYKMRERLFRMLSKVPIQVETEPSLSWQRYLQRPNCSPVHQLDAASASSSASTSNSVSSASSTSTSTPTTSSARLVASSRKIDQETLIIKYYNDRSLNDILEQHFGCALINHNFVLGLALDSRPQNQIQHEHHHQQRPQLQQNAQSLDNSGNFGNFSHEQQQQAFCMASDNEMCRESLVQQEHPIEQCLDWQSNQNSYNLSWQMAQHGTFDLAIPNTVQLRATASAASNVKKLTNQKRSTMNTVKDDHKYAPNTNQNQRQQAKRQRLSNSTRQHQNIAPSSSSSQIQMPINNVRSTNGQVKAERDMSMNSNGRVLPLSLVEYQQIPSGKRAFKEVESQREQEQQQQQQLLLVRQIHGKPIKYASGASGSSDPRLESDQHLVFDNSFIVSRTPVSSQSLHADQETRRSRSGERDTLGQYQQQSQQQLLNHNQLNNHAQLEGQQSELHNLYNPSSYLQHHVRQVEPRSEDQISISNCFEPHQSNLNHQLGQHFEQREASTCYVTSPQLAEQQQPQFPPDHSSYYQAQTAYLHVEPQTNWQCHSQLHLPPPLPIPPPHHQHQHHHHHGQQAQQQQQQQTLEDMSQEHMIEQHQQQATDGLLSDNYSVRRHNFVSQNSPYHLAEPTYSLVYQPDCNTAQLNVNLTTNNQGQQLLLIDETSQHLNHSVGQIPQLLN